jgi:hypothetical protein
LSEEVKPASKVYYQKEIESLDKRTQIVLSVESQTNDGAWRLFKKLKKEVLSRSV